MCGYGRTQVPVFSLLKRRMSGCYNLFLLIAKKIGSGFGKVNSQPIFSFSFGKCYINPFLLEEFLIIVGYVVLIFVLDVQQVQKQLSTVCFGVLTRLVFGKPAGWITFFYHYRAVTSSTGVGELVWNTV
jgi:hypothetical protein